MKNILLCSVALLAALTSPAAEKPAFPAAVTISGGKEGLHFFIFGTGSTGRLDRLGKTLKEEKYTSAILSGWARDLDCEAVLKDLEKHKIKVEMFYFLKSGNADWHRLNLVTDDDPEPAAPLPEELPIRPMLIEDNDCNRRYKLPGEFKEVKYITIHNTAEPFSAAQERDRVNSRRDRASVSFHYAVDENEAVQILPLNIHGWHAGDGRGDGNTRSIGIEICRSQCRDASDWRYRRSEENAVKLAAKLLKEYNLPVEALKMHRDWSGKFCPHRILEADAWEDFRERVRQRLDSKE